MKLFAKWTQIIKHFFHFLYKEAYSTHLIWSLRALKN